MQPTLAVGDEDAALDELDATHLTFVQDVAAAAGMPCLRVNLRTGHVDTLVKGRSQMQVFNFCMYVVISCFAVPQKHANMCFAVCSGDMDRVIGRLVAKTQRFEVIGALEGKTSKARPTVLEFGLIDAYYNPEVRGAHTEAKKQVGGVGTLFCSGSAWLLWLLTVSSDASTARAGVWIPEGEQPALWRHLHR